MFMFRQQRKMRGNNTVNNFSGLAVVTQLLLCFLLHLRSPLEGLAAAVERVEDHRHQQLHGGQLHQTTLEIVADAGVKTSTTSAGLDKDFSQPEVLEPSSSRPTPGPLHGKSSAAVPSHRTSHTKMTTRKTMSKKQAAVVPRVDAAATPGHDHEEEQHKGASQHQNVGGRQQASDDGRLHNNHEVGDAGMKLIEPLAHHVAAGARGHQHEKQHAAQSAPTTMRREKTKSESKTPADEELLEISTRPVHESRDKDDEVQALVHQAEVPRLQKNSTAAKENSTGLEGVQDALHAHGSRTAKRAPQLMTTERDRVTLVQRAEQALHQAEAPLLQKNSTAAKEKPAAGLLEGVQDARLHAPHSSRTAKRAPNLMASERNRLTLVQRAGQALNENGESKAKHKQGASADEADITPTDAGSATASSYFGNPDGGGSWDSPGKFIDNTLSDNFGTASDVNNRGTAQVCPWVQIDLGKAMAVSEVRYTFKTSHINTIRRNFFETVFWRSAAIQYEGGKDTAIGSDGAEIGGADKGFRVAVSSRERVNADTCEVQNTGDWQDGWCKGKAAGEECPTTAEETCELVQYGAGGEGLARFTQEDDHPEFGTATINCNGKVGQYVILEWPGGIADGVSKKRCGQVSELRVFGAEYIESPEKEGESAAKSATVDESAATTRIARPSFIFLAATTMAMVLATNFCAVWFGL
ncbi:unnamed protein product [Amoebophrya sp. A120]|nr:unnamed protein product [Amoebophrya sp. A120]|eukprot:GSA120T00017011001.1